MIFWQCHDGIIHQGHALDILRSMPEESVQCVVTSPPYWGLRNYGVEGQIGLEKTPEEYVAIMVQVFREVRRVLKKDGTLWLNLGDSYNAHPGQRTVHDKAGTKQQTVRGSCEAASRNTPGLKPKDLVGIPWRVAFALQADGWWLRSVIPWLKRNCMPESTKDRPTTAVEYVYLLSKSASYHYDHEAVKLPASLDSHARYARGRSDHHKWADGGPGGQTIAATFDHMIKTPANYKGSVPGRKNGPGQERRSTRDRLPGVTPKSQPAGSGVKANESFHAAVGDLVDARARRNSDWFMESWQGLLLNEDGDPLAFLVNSNGFKGSHFATFPPKLVDPMIQAGSRRGDTILDPFGGAGTVGLEAERLGRRWEIIELNPDYCQMARDRIEPHTLQMRLLS